MIYYRVYNIWNRYTFKDFIRKFFLYLHGKFNLLKLISKMKAYFYFKNSSLCYGNNIKVFGFSTLVSVGKDCSFYENCIFEFSENSTLIIGNNCILSYGVIIACNKSVTIGNDVQIGEYTSIRDTTHDYSEFGVPMKYNKDISKEISIGNNVWIGRNCLIQPGSIILDGTVVGANSIVKGIIGPNKIYAGSPLKAIKNR